MSGKRFTCNYILQECKFTTNKQENKMIERHLLYQVLDNVDY